MAPVVVVLALVLAACGGDATTSPVPGASEPSGTVRVYTSVTQDTVDAVLDVYAEVAPDVDVEVFRVPTGELDARIAAEQREGRIRGDVLWATDPLSVQSYAAQGLLLAWDPPEAASVPQEYQTDTFWGTRLLNMLIVHQAGMEHPPADWEDLTDATHADGVAIPDPLDTVAYSLRRAGHARVAARGRARELLELMGVGALAERRPSELSGGEQQRVSIARALAREARRLLLDEPTAHLDAPLRAALVAELAEQQRRSSATAVWATHDVTEALAMADRVGVLRAGRLVQVGTPRDLYERPIDLWTARLSGHASVLSLDVVARNGAEAFVEVNGRRQKLALDAESVPAPGTAQVLVRPDWVELGGELEASVTALWYRGPHTDYRLATPVGELEVRLMGAPRAAAGQRVTWRLKRGWAAPRCGGRSEPR